MEEDFYQEEQAPVKSIKGYKIVIVILAVILGGLSYMYFSQVRDLKREFAIERDTLTNRLTAMIANYDSLQVENDTIKENLTVARHEADSLLESLQKERSWSRRKIREYEKKMGLMRTVMEGYIHQIDSLNQLNTKLIGENRTYRLREATLRKRADMAEEQAAELSTKIRKGSVIRARDIRLTALNMNDKEVTRASRAAGLRASFVLAANELATPGERDVYVRITGPDGYVLANSSSAVFDFEGDKLSYSASRQVDYQLKDLDVSVYYSGSDITAGTYSVQIYMDGYLIGSNEIILR